MRLKIGAASARCGSICNVTNAVKEPWELLDMLDTRLKLIDMPGRLFYSVLARAGSASFVFRERRSMGACDGPRTEPETARRRAERAGERLLPAGNSFHGGIFAIP